ncbi:semialdehyde dehydrogenase [Marinihelvus fidelis]|uniref:Semialdehyde dehydrogenase n=1 Tax=Marinihelvus fidelis TaxID=2613842 RepID=A0A5N0T941_9GAMM|nr:phosphogluconate dehydrogenase C-terminal domain-containing protein [Marinihelvus fidelis]KAA9131563.1 semialdehyde dehydrogenase [Marinihelvus fidelis]
MSTNQLKTVAVIGAGGKMGFRISSNLSESGLDIRHVERNPNGRQRLFDELGVECIDADTAVEGADVVILAVPDTLIRQVSHQLAPALKPGTMVVVLDAAAPFAGHLPDRDDLAYFVTHPCHPSIFNDESDPDARRDFFGGDKARQAVVSSLMQGPEEAWDTGEAIARLIYAPVTDTYRLTVEQMALLEPGLSETVCATLLVTLREALDEVVARGVPKDAARAFLLGHMNILSAVIFDEIEGRFSDACYQAIKYGKPDLVQPDWKKVFEPDALAASIRRIT